MSTQKPIKIVDRDLVAQSIEKTDYFSLENLENIDDGVFRYWYGEIVDVSENKKYWQLMSLVLERAYGYRLSSRSKRLTRYTPSAGSMYPLEIMLSPPEEMSESPVIYSFENHCFFKINDVDLKPIRSKFKINKANSLIIQVAFFKRTIQRYSVRGYRYCLLDSSALLANLVFLGQSINSDVSILSGEINAELDKALSLEQNESSVLCIELSGNYDAIFSDNFKLLSEIPHSISPNVALHPKLEEMLAKVYDYHRSSLHGYASNGINIPTDLFSKKIGDLLADRFSANDFSQASQDSNLNLLEKLIPLWEKIQLPFNNNLKIYFLRFSVEADKNSIIEFELENKRIKSFVAQDNLRENFAMACQDQQLLYRCSCATIIATNSATLYGHPTTYRHAVLNAGYLDMLHQYIATDLDVGNSCIGGFSDIEITKLLGQQEVTPIVIHVFGEAVDGIKIDASQNRMKESLNF